ncbi:hypothetical protein M5689_006860 [Euphorbia peplus]|nr:hypothetical protein M5689_006860 [Euphorbia peplus]
MADTDFGSGNSEGKNAMVDPDSDVIIPIGIPISSTSVVRKVRHVGPSKSPVLKKNVRKRTIAPENSEPSRGVVKKKKPPTKVVRSVPPYAKGVPIRLRPGSGLRDNQVKIEVQYPRYYLSSTDTLLSHFLNLQQILWSFKGPLPRSLTRPKAPKSHAIADANTVLIREDLACIGVVFRIGSEFVLSSCSSLVRANSACRSNQVIVFESQFVAGMRLPLLPFFVEVLMEFNLAPGQIGTNGWRTMVALYSECRGKGLRPTGLVFRQLFKPVLAPTSEFVSWKHGRFNYLGGQPEKVPERRHRFFMVIVKSENEHFPFPTNWNPRPDDPRTWLAQRKMSTSEKVLTEMLLAYDPKARESVHTLVDNFLEAGWFVFTPWSRPSIRGFTFQAYAAYLEKHG